MPARRRSSQGSGKASEVGGPFAPDRFLGAAGVLPALFEPADDHAIVFQVIRPADLVALTVRAQDCRLVRQDGTAYLEADADALLVVTHSFQHALEEAQFEEAAPQPGNDGSPPTSGALPPDPTIPVTRPDIPVGFIPARSSRVVFAVPEGSRIEFSIAGVLDALTRLQMVVHPLATPGPVPDRGETPGKKRDWVIAPPFIHLGDGLVLEDLGHTVQIRKPTRAFFRSNPAPDTSTPQGAALAARELKRAREVLATRTPVVAKGTRIPAASEFRPGGPWVPHVPARIRQRQGKSSAPGQTQTAIEAPYRLIISPHDRARWAHAARPVTNPDAQGHVELWHSRLAGPPLGDPTDEAPGPNNENDLSARTMRAIWTRDRDTVPNWWQPDDPTNGPVAGVDHPDPDDPFLASLDRADRNMLVRQTSETWEGATKPSKIAPTPFRADALWLSGLGAWLDLHGAWNTKPYSEQSLWSIMDWDHVAPMGRDQYVRVVYPGYLFPFGHQAALVKVTERKMKTADNSVASLYQRMFIVIGQRSRAYGLDDAEARQFPFDRIDLRPLATPPLDKPSGTQITTFFWPRVGQQDFRFVIDAWDREGRPVRMTSPLLWVNEAFHGFKDVQDAYAKNTNRRIAVHGQPVSFVRRGDDPDTDLQTESVYLLGRAMVGDSVPRMSAATVQVPAVQRLNPQDGPMPIRYYDRYLEEGFDEGQSGRVWAVTLGPGSKAEGDQTAKDPVLPSVPDMGFGQGGASSDRTGGFMAPSLPLAALARDRGPVGDPDNVRENIFDPKKFLAGVDAKLFGIVDLWDLIPQGMLDQAPTFVTETLGKIEGFLATLDRLEKAVEEAKLQASLLQSRLGADPSAALKKRADDAVAAANKLSGDVAALLTEARNLIKVPGSPLVGLDTTATAAALGSVQTKLGTVITDLDALGVVLPPQAAQLVRTISGALHEIQDLTALAAEVQTFVNALDPRNLQLSMHFEWAPNLQDWPPGKPTLVKFLPDGPGPHRNLVLRVEGKATATGEMRAEAVAEIRDLELRLFGDKPLIVFPIHHMFFKAGSSGKPEVDVLLGDLEFRNELSFIETIKDLIPFDGFSDPPYVDVDSDGARAGFTLALPNVAVGVFNLSNISLGADVSVPFLGSIVTAGFDFCTREKPFSLTVMCLGGGGWFGLRVSPEGLEVLELGLEAQACLAVDFGVASGSISAGVGVYLRLEAEKGSLTGYFRLRGEVDVLGLISASIELYMSLTYHTDTGKMVGRATITVEVDVLCFSGSVKISAERQLAGSNGDPSFREILGAESTGTSPYWTTYCDAFAGE